MLFDLRELEQVAVVLGQLVADVLDLALGDRLVEDVDHGAGVQRRRREVVVDAAIAEVLVALGDPRDELSEVEGLGGVGVFLEEPTQLVGQLCREVRRLALLNSLAQRLKGRSSRAQRRATGASSARFCT